MVKCSFSFDSTVQFIHSSFASVHNVKYHYGRDYVRSCFGELCLIDTPPYTFPKRRFTSILRHSLSYKVYVFADKHLTL